MHVFESGLRVLLRCTADKIDGSRPVLTVQMSTSNTQVPSRRGKPWDEHEIRQLLNEIQINLDISEIAKEHQRTTGGIRSRLRELAWEYHLEGRTINEIQRFTRLDERTINEVIRMKQIKQENLESQKDASSKKELSPTSPQVKKETVLDALQRIESLLKELVELNKEKKKVFLVKKAQSALENSDT